MTMLHSMIMFRCKPSMPKNTHPQITRLTHTNTYREVKLKDIKCSSDCKALQSSSILEACIPGLCDSHSFTAAFCFPGLGGWR